MLAPLTATTGLTGLSAECLSAPARGMAGDDPGAGVVGVAVLDEILTVMTEASGAAVSSATEALTVEALPAVRLVSTEAVGSAATVDFMVAVVDSTVAVVDSTVAEGSTVEAAEAFTVEAAASTAAVVADSTEVGVVDTLVADTGNPGTAV